MRTSKQALICVAAYMCVFNHPNHPVLRLIATVILSVDYSILATFDYDTLDDKFGFKFKEEVRHS